MTDVLQYECLRAFGVNDFSNVKDKGSPCIVESPHIPNYAEWLTRESCEQNIVVRDSIWMDDGNVARGLDSEIVLICPARLKVDVTSKYAPHTQPARGYMEAPDATEHVCESEAVL